MIHVASPFPAENPRDEMEVIGPAVEGTKNVLEACAKTKGGVKRVVLTSSCAAIYGKKAEWITHEPKAVHTTPGEVETPTVYTKGWFSPTTESKSESESEAEAEEPTNHKAWSRVLWLVYSSASVSDSPTIQFSQDQLIWFSLDRIVFYASDYSSDYDSVASENQP